VCFAGGIQRQQAPVDRMSLRIRPDPACGIRLYRCRVRMTERFRRPTYGTPDIQITIDDPKAYTRPWTVEMPQRITLDTELIDEICLENEKSWQRMQRSQ
jgi:hypothetical protein